MYVCMYVCMYPGIRQSYNPMYIPYHIEIRPKRPRLKQPDRNDPGPKRPGTCTFVHSYRLWTLSLLSNFLPVLFLENNKYI